MRKWGLPWTKALKTLSFVWTQKYCPSGNIWGAVVFLLFFHIKDLLSSVFFRKFAREKYKYNKEVKVEVKMEVKVEVKR